MSPTGTLCPLPPVSIGSPLGAGGTHYLPLDWSRLLPKLVPGTVWHKARLPVHQPPILAPGAPPGGGDREVMRWFCLRPRVHACMRGSARLPPPCLSHWGTWRRGGRSPNTGFLQMSSRPALSFEAVKLGNLALLICKMETIKPPHPTPGMKQ